MTRPAAPTKAKQVIVYSTSWCDACKSLKAYLQELRVPYLERDIEKDPKAEAEMNSKLKAIGRGAASVLPVTDVDRTIYVGFDAARPIPIPGYARPKVPQQRLAPPASPKTEAESEEGPKWTIGGFDYRYVAATGMGVVGGATVGYWAFDHAFGRGMTDDERKQVAGFALSMGILWVAGQLGYEKWVSAEGIGEKVQEQIAKATG